MVASSVLVVAFMEYLSTFGNGYGLAKSFLRQPMKEGAISRQIESMTGELTPN